MKHLAHNSAAKHKSFSLKVLIGLFTILALAITPLASMPTLASANTDVTLYVKAVDESGTAALSSANVRACYYATTSVCATGATGSDGTAAISISVPTANMSLSVSFSHASKLTEIAYLQVAAGVITNGGVTVDATHPLSATLKPRYTLEGYIYSGTNNVAGRKAGFALSYYKETTPGQSTCANVVTDSNGKYSITDVTTSSPMVYPYACNTSNINTYDRFEPGFQYSTYLSALNASTSGTATFFTGVATKDFELKQTGIKVHVTDGTNALSGVSIRLVPTTCPNTSCWEPQATTDGNGDAIFAALTPGDSWKAAYPNSSYQGSSVQMTQYVSKVNSTPTTVASSGLITDQLVLTRTPGYPETPVSVSGKIVTGLSNTPIAGAQVSMNWNSRVGSTFISGNSTTTTDNSGNYTFSNMPYGNIYINISNLSGYRNASISKFTSQATGTTYAGVDLNLRPAAVGNLSYSGTLKTSGGAGTPIPNRTINLYQMGGSTSNTVQTDANGAFGFTGLAEGNYYLNVDTWSDASYQNLPWSSSSFLLTSNVAGADLRLTARSVGTATATGFVGEYVDKAGSQSAIGIAGKPVYIYPQSGGQGFSATTASDGTWTVTGLTAGHKYWVSVMNINFQDYEYPSDANSFTVPISGAVDHKFLLKRISAGTGSLTGRVKNASTYANLPGITVNLYRSYGGVTVPSVLTNAKGEYSFANLPAGEYYMMLSDATTAYFSAGVANPAGAKFKSASMSVEIGDGANRVNALLSPISTYPGTVSGVIKDERGVLMSNASVQVWDPNDSTIGGYASTNSSGEYKITGVPIDRALNFKVEPPYDLRFEVTTYNDLISLSQYVQSATMDVQLEKAGLVSGFVSGIPTSGNIPMVWVQLIDPSSGTVMATDWVNTTTGVYTIKSVKAGTYYLRFTQMGSSSGYTGGGGSGASGGGDSGELISLKPVYWDGSPTGTTSKTGLPTINVGLGARVVDKSITMTRGSIITGDVSIETPSGVTKITGTRWLSVTVYQKQPNGDYNPIGYPVAVSGYSNSKLEIAGLAAGTYKLKFEDYRKGTNSLATVYNGGATNIASAPEIVVGDQETVTWNQTMKMAAPEKSADAFNLDDLEAARLAELENQISTSGTLQPGGQTQVFVGVEFAGEYVSAVANSTPVALGGWQQVDKNGYISVSIPLSLSGSHRIAVQDANSQVIGWTAVQIGTDATASSGKLRWRDTGSTEEATPALVAQPAPLVKAANTQPIPDNSGWQWWALGGLLLALAVIAAVWAIIARRRQ